VCKKYSTFYPEDQDIYYKRFIEEIKILYKLNHKNIVRVFNYYLYPEKVTGYIIMEYIEGSNIEEFIEANPTNISDIFTQVIEAFKHLEKNGILHRDIRPQNILVSVNGEVKIIDFGFGKKTHLEDENEKSVTLNWYFDTPLEFSDNIYDFKSEVYFIGKLFEQLTKQHNITSFDYESLIDMMVEKDPTNRISSFFQVYRETISEEKAGVNFSWDEKMKYRSFASSLEKVISAIEKDTSYKEGTEQIIEELEELVKNSILELRIQNTRLLARPFLNGAFKYKGKADIPVDTIKDFLKVFKKMPMNKREIVLNHIWNRLDKIDIYDSFSDLPF